MARDLTSSISAYIGHFSKKVERLRAYELEEKDQIFKKNILVSILDALSRTTSNSTASNRERFTSIVKNFGEWQDHTRVSVPHLGHFLRFLRDPNFGSVRDRVHCTISKNLDGRLVYLSEDPEFVEIQKLWPAPAEQKLVSGLSLSSFTHINLLYEYRNSLIHELREPGYGMEFPEDREEPYYHLMSTLDSDDTLKGESLELVYPVNFYFRLVECVLMNLEPYLRENRINPYSCYPFGSAWMGELNRWP